MVYLELYNTVKEHARGILEEMDKIYNVFPRNGELKEDGSVVMYTPEDIRKKLEEIVHAFAIAALIPDFER